MLLRGEWLASNAFFSLPVVSMNFFKMLAVDALYAGFFLSTETSLP
jgi:hypothetical protein